MDNTTNTTQGAQSAQQNTAEVQTQQTNATPAGTGGKTFTQEEVNRIVADRLARERSKAAPEQTPDPLAEREKNLQPVNTPCSAVSLWPVTNTTRPSCLTCWIPATLMRSKARRTNCLQHSPTSQGMRRALSLPGPATRRRFLPVMQSVKHFGITERMNNNGYFPCNKIFPVH